MQRVIALLFAALCCFRITAGNTIAVSQVSGSPGDEVQVTLSLDNSDAVVAIEAVMPLDENLEYVEGSMSLSSDRSNGHSLSAQFDEDKRLLNIYVFSFSNVALSGNQGTLLTFKLKLSKEPGTYSLIPQAVISDAQGSGLSKDISNGQVTILAPKIELVTSSIDYGHVPIRADYSRTIKVRNSGNELLTISNVQLGSTELSTTETSFSISPGVTKSLELKFHPENRGNFSETVSFVSNAVNGIAKVNVLANPFSVNELHVSNASGVSDSEVEISLTMNNMEPIVGVQCDFNLPSALQYVDGSLTLSDRASALAKVCGVNGQKLSVFIYSDNNTSILGNDGQIATFKLNLLGSKGNYSVNPQSVVLSNVMMENMTSASSGGTVSIKSPTLSCNSTCDMGSNDVTGMVRTLFPIKNTGNADLVIEKVTFLTEGFAIADTVPVTVAQGQTCYLTVCYQPQKAGKYSGTMNIYSNDPNRRLCQVSVTGSTYEPNSIGLTGQFVNECQDYLLDFDLNNYSSIVGVQMDLTVPKGLECNASDLVGTTRIAGLSTSFTKITDGKYRIILFSMNNKSIADNTGNILSLTLHLRGEFESGCNINVSNVVLSGVDGNNKATKDYVSCLIPYPKYAVTYMVGEEIAGKDSVVFGDTIIPCAAPDIKGYVFTRWDNLPVVMPAHDVTVTGLYYAIGDANGDGEINVSDFTAIASRIMGNPPATFVEKAADVNQDGEINVGDLTAVATIILHGSQKVPMREDFASGG